VHAGEENHARPDWTSGRGHDSPWLLFFVMAVFIFFIIRHFRSWPQCALPADEAYFSIHHEILSFKQRRHNGHRLLTLEPAGRGTVPPGRSPLGHYRLSFWKWKRCSTYEGVMSQLEWGKCARGKVSRGEMSRTQPGKDQ